MTELSKKESASQVPQWVKNLPKMQETGNVSSIPGSGRSPGGRHSNPLQYSCLEKPMDRGAWWAIVHRVAESDTSEETEHSIAAQERIQGDLLNTLLSYFS